MAEVVGEHIGPNYFQAMVTAEARRQDAIAANGHMMRSRAPASSIFLSTP